MSGTADASSLVAYDHAHLRERTGAGVSVAVIDSGYHPGHPHLGPIRGGIALDVEGRFHDDLTDRLGHGTAVTAAIQEKAPAVDLHVVKVFNDALATTTSVLARAIDWTSERSIRLVNLSLGTPHAPRAEVLEQALARAVSRGTIVVSAFEHEGKHWFPGALSGALGVLLDYDVPRDAVRIEPRRETVLLAASGYPRPIPGVPPERNLKGVSFAVANATGILARALEGQPSIRTAEAAIEALEGGRAA